MTPSKIHKKLAVIKAWLQERGAEVLAETNQYELLRFKSSHGVSVLYCTARGAITPTGQTRDALEAFFEGKPWSSGNKAKRRPVTNTQILTLLKRDGEDCFLCLDPLGDDITKEHLCCVGDGGPDRIANLALAHRRCNEALGHLSVMEKVRLREGNLLRKHGITVPAPAPDLKAA